MDVQTRLLLAVAKQGALTRREIADNLGISVSTVSKAVGSLAGAGLVIEEETTSTGQGRPAMAVRLRPSAGYAVGVAVAGDYLSASLTDMCGTVLGRTQRRTVLTTSKSRLLDQLLGLIGATVEAAGVRPETILGYGIGLHAPLDNQTGKCAGWPNTPEWSSLWEGLALRDELVGDLGPNTLVGNANRFAALAEHRFGSGQGEDHFFYIHIGQGVGGAAFLGGRPYPTLRGVSGEVGHITVDENGPWCNCGNAGCLEALISTPAILEYARNRLEAGRESLLRSMCSDDWSQLTVGMIIEAATRGDKFSYNVLNRYGELAGTGLAAAMNLLGTELVIVRSEFVKGQELTIEAIRRTVILRALPLIARHARVVPATFGAEGPSLGAATYVIQQAVTQPTRMLAMQ